MMALRHPSIRGAYFGAAGKYQVFSKALPAAPGWQVPTETGIWVPGRAVDFRDDRQRPRVRAQGFREIEMELYLTGDNLRAARPDTRFDREGTLRRRASNQFDAVRQPQLLPVDDNINAILFAVLCVPTRLRLEAVPTPAMQLKWANRVRVLSQLPKPEFDRDGVTIPQLENLEVRGGERTILEGRPPYYSKRVGRQPTRSRHEDPRIGDATARLNRTPTGNGNGGKQNNRAKPEARSALHAERIGIKHRFDVTRCYRTLPRKIPQRRHDASAIRTHTSLIPVWLGLPVGVLRQRRR
jgi:hypothetical protein